MTWQKQLYYGLLVFSLIAFFLNRKKLPKHNLFLGAAVVLALSTQLIAEVLKRKGLSFYFLFHLYIPAEYFLLSLYYASVFSNTKAKKYLLLSALGFLFFSFVKYFVNNSFWLPDYTDFVIESVIVSILVLVFFLRLFKKEDNIDLFRYSDFWINTGNLFFYSGCLFVMGLHFTIRNRNEDLSERLLIINNYLNLILYLFYLIAFTCHRANRK